MPPPRVLVTRAAHQASTLATELRASGLDPIVIPALELAEPSSFAPLDTALADLPHVHWLLFTSGNAVRVFSQRLAERSALAIASHPALPPGLRLAAIGASTAQAIVAAGLAPSPAAVLLPPLAVAESLAAALTPFARQPDGSPTRMLLVRAEAARDVLPDTLRAAGAHLTVVPAYRNRIPPSSVQLLQAVLGSPHEPLAAATFTSSSSVTNLLALCEAAGVVLPPQTLRISIGPVTSQTLREAGLPPYAESPEATVAALARTVALALVKPPSTGLRS